MLGHSLTADDRREPATGAPPPPFTLLVTPQAATTATSPPLAIGADGRAFRIPSAGVLDRLAGIDPAVRSLGFAAKRGLDLFGAAFGLIFLAPVFLAIAVAIVLTDGRPIFFRQPRAGRYGRPFSIVKFRSMYDGADALRAQLRVHNEVAGGASFKMTDDPRITPVGRILRRTSLDELPQLWNVLWGDMSLVGPRPHPFDDLDGYAEWHFARLAMKPGMTGLWQVSARRETDFDRWVHQDLDYIRRWSIRLDVSILLRTIPAVVRGSGR